MYRTLCVFPTSNEGDETLKYELGPQKEKESDEFEFQEVSFSETLTLLNSGFCLVQIKQTGS